MSGNSFNDPHTSKSVTAWVRKNKITVLPWPSINPDFNPIENLWPELKVQINHESAKNLQELECITIEEWKKITKKTCSNLIKNFRKWLQQVIKKERSCYWLLILRKLFNFSYGMNNFVFSSFVYFLLLFSKFNKSLSKLSFIFLSFVFNNI